MRDGFTCRFTCQSCGASPIKERGVELYVDHIIPWSKGGETEEPNLRWTGDWGSGQDKYLITKDM